ncbi:MAG: hypothetical protein AAFU79_20060 [Myxococcota bacterium]
MRKQVVTALLFVSALAAAPRAEAHHDGLTEEHPVLTAAAERRAEARKVLSELKTRRDLARLAPEAPRASRAFAAPRPAVTVAPVEVKVETPQPVSKGVAALSAGPTDALAAK